MSAAAILAQLTAAGCRVTLRPDGRISLRPAPAPDLLALARQHRDELVRLCAAKAPVETANPPSPSAPASRPTRPGALSSDPPAPVVAEAATVTLAKLELVGAGPDLRADGQLGLAHSDACSPELLALAECHHADIAALVVYRALIEELRPATPLPQSPASHRTRPRAVRRF